MTSFDNKRRQKYIDEQSYRNTLNHYRTEIPLYQENLQTPETYPGDHAQFMYLRALDMWSSLQLRYTGGDSIEELRRYFGEVIDAYQAFVDKGDEADDEHYRPPFLMADFFDTYVEYLHIVCAAILLHREDLLPTILNWNEGTDFGGIDAVLEELFKFYFPDRPDLDSWLWSKPYSLLLDAIDEPDAAARPQLMKTYVKKWYPSMKGNAAFYGKHEEIEPDFSPYVGYWALCAAAFSYLYDIDDKTYRDEIVYPKDLVDYARSVPRQPALLQSGDQMLRVPGGLTCPRSGFWFSPASQDSARNFVIGELMPIFEQSEYGATIWQWVSD